MIGYGDPMSGIALLPESAVEPDRPPGDIVADRHRRCETRWLSPPANERLSTAPLAPILLSMTTYEPTAPIRQRNVVLLAGGARALARAADLVDGRDRLIVVAAAHFHAEPVATEGAHIDPSDLRHGREDLDNAAAFFAERGIVAETILAQGNPADIVVTVAEQQNADLIIVGNDTPTLLERLRGAPLSGRLAYRAPCDVLIVH